MGIGRVFAMIDWGVKTGGPRGLLAGYFFDDAGEPLPPPLPNFFQTTVSSE